MAWTRPPRARRFALLGVALATAVLLPACRGSGFVYIQSADGRAFFKVPSNWTMFQKRDMLVATKQRLSAAANQQFPLLVGFDSNPNPSIQNVLDITKPLQFPAVQAREQILPSGIRDTTSFMSLRNYVLDLDRLTQANVAEIVSYKELVLPGGFHGNRTVYDISLQGVSGVQTGNSVIRFDQTAIVDSGARTLYFFLVRCESHCWQGNSSLLTQIVDSWTVKEH